MAERRRAPGRRTGAVEAASWQVFLLGRARVSRVGEAGETVDRKAAALLAYLALQGPASRERLAYLFWPQHERAAARRNLRHWLFKLNRFDGLLAGGDPLVLVPSVRVDLLELRGLARSGARGEADKFVDDLIRNAGGGAFLAGFEYDDCPDLQEWVAVERAGAQSVVKMVLEAEAEAAVDAGHTTRGVALMEAAWALDPLSESALERLLAVLVRAGQATVARRRYDEARQRFLAELGGEPEIRVPLELAAAVQKAPGDQLPRPAASELAGAVRLLRSIAGPVFSVELAAAVANARPEAVLSALEESRTAGEQEHEQPSPVIRAYLHRRVAAFLEKSGKRGAVVAEHWIAGDEPVHAVKHLQDEAASTLAAGKAADAALIYERAVELAGADVRLATEPLLRIEELSARGGEVARRRGALDRLDQRAIALQDDALILETRLRRADLLLAQGRLDDAGTMAEIALDDSARLRDAAARDRARMILGAVSFRQSRWAEAEAFFASASRARDHLVKLRAATNLGSVQGMRGRYEESQRSFQRALTLARKVQAEGVVPALLNNLAANSERLGWYARADQYLQEGVELAERSGETRGLIPTLANQAMVRLHGARFAGAHAAARRARALAAGASDPALLALAALALGVVWRGLGRGGEARAELAEAARIRGESADERGLAAARFNLECLVLEGDPGRDSQAAVEALTTLERLGPAHFASAGWAELALIGEDPDRAREWAERAERLGHTGHLRMVAALSRLRASLIEGTPAPDTRDEEYLEEYLDRHTVAESSLAHLLMAELHARSGSPEVQRHARRAATLLEAEAAGLDAALASSRREYVERRARVPERAATR